MEISTRLDAAELRGMEGSHNPWRKALLVVRNVNPGEGSGTRTDLGKRLPRFGDKKVSMRQFADEAGVSHPTVSMLYQRWDKAFAADLVPKRAADVELGEELEVPTDAKLWVTFDQPKPKPKPQPKPQPAGPSSRPKPEPDTAGTGTVVGDDDDDRDVDPDLTRLALERWMNAHAALMNAVRHMNSAWNHLQNADLVLTDERIHDAVAFLDTVDRTSRSMREYLVPTPGQKRGHMRVVK
jgi:hypothetical protein